MGKYVLLILAQVKFVNLNKFLKKCYNINIILKINPKNMRKKFISFFAILAFLCLNLSLPTQAATNYKGKIVKMEGLSTLYYVGADNKRYVFPNSKIYDSWFTSFDNVKTLSQDEITSLSLGGNVRYRPGILLVKITTDPKVYAVGKNGVLRWITNETVAKALYGENWNQLIDDVPDSFFTNYQIGDSIYSASDYDTDEEISDVDNIDTNHSLSSSFALKSNTHKCQIKNQKRYYKADDSDDEETDDEDDSDSQNDGSDPSIDKINVLNSGNSGYIDTGDEIIITFSEAIDPSSINEDLEVDSYVNSLEYGITGSISVFSDGLVEIKNIASFDLGSVGDTGQFAVKLDLSSNAKVLTIMILGGNEIRIDDEDFEDAKQIGGTVKDTSGNFMEADNDIGKPSGSFGGENTNDGIEPYITKIKAFNYGSNNYIDVGDEIRITFSEEIDPESINDDLTKGGSAVDIEANETGGVSVNDNGILTIEDISSFFVGNVEEDGEFIVSLALDSNGDTLTITLTGGNDVRLDDEDLDDAEQIGDTVEDRDGNEMEDDPNISDPLGTFVGDSESSDLYITHIKAYDDGYAGYIDENDRLVITFSQAIDPESINTGTVLYDETGGVYVESNGLFHVTDILSFDIGEVAEEGQFEISSSLSSGNKVLTITIIDGDAIKIDSEVFSNTTQIGGYISDEDGDAVLDNRDDIDNPSGTFGGDSSDTPPYITSIEVTNGGDSSFIDVNDKITITFNEAIDPESIDNDLELDDEIEDIDDDDTGGINVDDDGFLTVADIAKFYVGSVDDDGKFDVDIAINEIGNIIVITLQNGNDIEISYLDLDDASQIGGTIEDEDGDKMEDDPRIDDPSGNF